MMFHWTVAAILIGFALAGLTCAALLPLARKWHIVKRAYEDAPGSHQVKTGTPTLGGICFIVALLPLVVAHADLGQSAVKLFYLVLACTIVGAVDDLIAVRSERSRGLRARTKFLLTALIAVIFLRALDPSIAPVGTILELPGFSLHVAYWLWLLLGIAAIAGTIHAVNLTDGLDGLAAGAMVWPLAALGAASFLTASAVPALAAALGVGACLAFLIYNRYPARLFMGDAGSLALGALLAGTAILAGQMLLLLVAGGVFVAEAVSVMLQVAYFKATHGKRIFKMSPLHHHFELSGWPETKVTARFWIASALCSAVGLAIVR